VCARNQAFQARSRPFGQGVPGCPHVGELGFPSLGRDDAGGWQREARGHPLEAAVGVPQPVPQRVKPQSIVLGAHLVVLTEIGDVCDVRVQARHIIRPIRANGGLQIAEPAAERHLLLIPDELVGEHEDAQLADGIVDRRDGQRIQRLAQIDPGDLANKERVQLLHGD
jgi:hypothetical protein